jgi:hypothetical protein
MIAYTGGMYSIRSLPPRYQLNALTHLTKENSHLLRPVRVVPAVLPHRHQRDQHRHDAAPADDGPPCPMSVPLHAVGVSEGPWSVVSVLSSGHSGILIDREGERKGL